MLNLAHGELVMIGAYCAYVVQSNGLPYLAAVPLALAVCGVLGYVVERWLVRPLYQRPFDTLVVTWGLSLLIRKCAEAMFDKAGATDAKKLAAASEGLAFDSASGRVTMHGRQVDKDMYLATCKGTDFEVIKTIKAVKSGTACKA